MSQFTCEKCHDTHVIKCWDQDIMCTHCPVPCQKCRAGGNGPYCEHTPCDCSCHKKDKTVKVDTPRWAVVYWCTSRNNAREVKGYLDSQCPNCDGSSIRQLTRYQQ